MPNDHDSPQYIDVTPTWSALLPAMLALIERQGVDSLQGRATRTQFEAMAKAADKWNDYVRTATGQRGELTPGVR